MLTASRRTRSRSRSRSPPHSRRVRWRSRSASGERKEARKRRSKCRSPSSSPSPPPPPPKGSRSPVGGRHSDSESRSPRNRTTREDPPPSRVLGVFGMSYHTGEMDLEQEFGRYGRIRDAQIIRTPDGASKGFGFITFKHLEDAEEARRIMSGQMLHGRRVRVDFSITQKPHEKTPGEYRGDNGYYYRGGHFRSRSPRRRSGRRSPTPPRYRRSYSSHRYRR